MVRYGAVWSGVVWYVWYGVVCGLYAQWGLVGYGVVWYGRVRYNMVWYDISEVSYHMVCYGIVWYSSVQYGMVCYPAVGYGRVLLYRMIR